MKKNKMILAFVCIALHKLYQQNNIFRSGDLSSTHWEYDIYSSEFTNSCKILEKFISDNNYIIIKQNETKFTHNYLFRVPKNTNSKTDSILKLIGYISNKELKYYNNLTQLTESKLQLEYLENKKTEYEKMQIKLDSVSGNKYYEHWEKTRSIETEIYEMKKKIKNLETLDSSLIYSIEIKDEVTSPSYSRVNFIHMPGFEYTYLTVEQPKMGVSHKFYQGINLKYLFTKGKSFFQLGAFKASSDSIKNDSIAYQELFMFEFGQDFYSRHFGRGVRKFLNLYIGYKTGLSVATNDLKIDWIPSISPNLGVEIFKNKYFCLDTRVNYFLPMINNRNLRGWAFSGAFNFVF